MHKVYDRWPELARTAFESDVESFDIEWTDHIVFVGMGGSGLLAFINLIHKFYLLWKFYP